MADERPIDPDRIKADNDRALNRIRALIDTREPLPEYKTDPPEEATITDRRKE